MNFIEISGRRIGEGYPPFVIAEIGINHEGEIEKAIQMVDDAISANCECVKFQYHIISDEMIPNDVIPGNAEESIWEIMKRCSLTKKEEIYLKDYVTKKGLIYLSTPFSRAAANELNFLGVDWFKIGSGECNNYPLINHIASFKKPIILSTGMNNIDSIRPAVDIFRNNKVPYALLHCTSMYPTPYDKVRLGAIKELKNEYMDGGYKVIQEFIKEPLLVNKRILVVRMYLLLKKDNEGYQYAVHKYGKCLYTPKDFSLDGLEEKRLITDSTTIIDDRFPKDSSNLLEYGVNKEIFIYPIESVLKCFKKYVDKLDEQPYQEQLTFFQLFGVDIILDNKLNPYLLEINKNPDMGNIYYDYDRKMKNEVISDVKELVKNDVYTNFIKL